MNICISVWQRNLIRFESFMYTHKAGDEASADGIGK